MNEKEFQNQLHNKLDGNVKKGGTTLGKEIPIPYQLSFVVDNIDQKILEIWCFKQDIVFFKPLLSADFPHRGAVVQYDKQALINIKLERGGAPKKAPIGMPLLIIETKMGHPTTDVILAYTKKAELIKSIFPYCKYVFCISGEKIDPRANRLGTNFDKIVSIENINNGNVEEFYKIIRRLLKEAKKELKEFSVKSGSGN